MSGLRERGPRPSYATLPPEFAHLSDEEIGEASNPAGPSRHVTSMNASAPLDPRLLNLHQQHDQAMASSSPYSDDGLGDATASNRYSSAPPFAQGSDDEMSSGESDAWKPPKKDDGKGKRSKGKGKAVSAEKKKGAGREEGSDSDDFIPDEEEDDTIMDIDQKAVLDTKYDLQTIDDRPRDQYGQIKGKSRAREPGALLGVNTGVIGRPDLAGLPPEYRAAMESLAERMIRSTGQAYVPTMGGEEQDDPLPPVTFRNSKTHLKTSRPVMSYLPRGPPLPWSSLIRRDADGTEHVVYRTGESKENRKWRMGRLGISCPLGTPRLGYEGEGFYPEMYDSGSADTSVDQGDEEVDENIDLDPVTGQRAHVQQPGRPKVQRETSEVGASLGALGQTNSGRIQDTLPAGWTLRQEVRLGLDHIGRLDPSGFKLLTVEQAEPYLPTVIDAMGNPHFTFHLGPLPKQKERQLTLFDTFAHAQYSPAKQGWSFNAGGPVWGMDWCPLPPNLISINGDRHFLAVSTLPHIDTAPTIGEKWPRTSEGCVQIWSIPTASADDGASHASKAPKCEMVLCIRGGPIMACKWMPMGAWDRGDEIRDGLPKIGILACVQLDGAVSIYTVPSPRHVCDAKKVSNDTSPIYVEINQSIGRLELPDASATCLEWLTGGKLVVAYSNGCIAVWDVLSHLKDPSAPCREPPDPALRALRKVRVMPEADPIAPHHFVTVTSSTITSIAVARIPPKDGNNRFIFDADPYYVAVSSYDLTMRVVDLRDPQFPIEMHRTRLPSMAVAFSQQNVAPIICDLDYVVQMFRMKDAAPSKSVGCAVHRGPIWDIGTTDYHTMIVSGSTDGSAMLSSVKLGTNRVKLPSTRIYLRVFDESANTKHMLMQRLFEIDYDPQTGHYRLLDNFAPESQTIEQATSRIVNSTPAKADETVLKTAAWNPRVAVHRVAWNQACGILHAGMLAVGTASGLVRIEEPTFDFWEGRDEEFVQAYGACDPRRA